MRIDLKKAMPHATSDIITHKILFSVKEHVMHQCFNMLTKVIKNIISN